MGAAEKLDSYFGIRAHGSTISTEVRAGIVTFLAMAYILIVCPAMMSDAGMDFNAALTATALSSAIACIVMALYAKFPIALAPGMGISTFFSYTVVTAMGYTYQQALAAVFISGFLFLILSVGGVRKKLLDSIPKNLRISITAGIGCFIAFVGLKESGIVVGSSTTIITMGDMSDPAVILALFGIVITTALVIRKVVGSYLLGIVITAAIGMIFGVVSVPSSIVSMPSAPEFGAFWEGLLSVPLTVEFAVVVISFLFVDFFDSAGTILAIGDRAGLIDENGSLVNGNQALATDAAATVAGSVIGISSVTSFCESTVGIEAGGRTGLMPFVIGALFIVAMFFAPLFSIITGACTVAILIIVGSTMMSSVSKIDWHDNAMAITAFCTILFTVLCYSITDGIGIGMIIYCLTMIASGRWRQVNIPIYIMAALFILYFFLGTTY